MIKNKKLLFWVGLLSSLIIPIQTNASDFSTISIANPDNPNEWFTIMDRNLWATSNDITSPNSYWYYFQWWNNYWFPSNKWPEKIWADKVDASNYWPWNYYENDTYIIWNENWDLSNNNNLWWWENDNEDNWRWMDLNNPTDRQWPCPNWYHIPSLWEWLLLTKYWADANNKTYNYYPERGVLELNQWYSEFRKHFKIPLAGEYYTSGSNDIFESNYWNYLDGNDYEYDSVFTRFQWHQWNPSSRYRSSSPSTTSTKSRDFYMDDIFYFYVGNTDNRNHSSSIRCFKNTYEPEFSIDTTKCEPMKNPNIYHTIKNDTIILGWDDIKWDNMEISIYDPEKEIYKNLWTVKMNNEEFTYKAKWDWEQNFKFSNWCSEYYYKVTTKCDWMEYASISHTVKNDTVTFKWNAIGWNTVEISIYDPEKEIYKNLWTVKMNNEEFTYKAKWDWEQNFKFSNWCKDYYYKIDVNLDNENFVELDGNLVNSIKKTTEFKSYEVSKKVVFNGTYTALKDTTINYYWIETSYDESKGNSYLDKRCSKNKTDMTFYVYVDWKMIDNTFRPDTCTLWQGAGFGKWINEITFKKWETKIIKVEIEMSWSVQEEDIYNFELSLNNVDKNIRDFEKWKVKANFNIKILNNEKDSVNSNIEKEKNQNNTKITTVKKSDWNPSEILQNWYSREMNDAYQFAHDNRITTTNNIEKAKINSPLTRIAMAKMLSYYAINVLWQKPNSLKWTIKFNDVTDKENSEYNNAVTLSYQLWIMWQNMKNNNFRPNDEVTRAEFATALSRMLYWTQDWSPYYTTHLNKLKQEWIITNDNPKLKEKRGYVMLMLMRTAE